MVHLTYIYTVLDVAKILSILQVPKRSAIKECPSPRDAHNLSLRFENVCISRR